MYMLHYLSAKMAATTAKVTDPRLDEFVVEGVQLTGNQLGVGAYGSVEEATIPGAVVAAKKLHSQLINLGSPHQVRKWVTDFVEECKLMSQLRHPHIVQFLGVAYLPGSSIPVLLMEKLQSSLDNLLETGPNIPLDIKVYLLTGTSRGVIYLHSRTPPIAHRDLTARNILIDSGLTAKIADLGMARMVNIQPGELAVRMTAGPGNNLYMPPETVLEEGTTRYNTAIDIFSFGVVSLFTLMQVFPKDLKPPNYRDPVTRKVLGRTEIERREHYIQPMQTAFGETHPLVKLTLDCLEYDPEDRPSAVEVLGQLEDVGKTVPQCFTETKLELIQQIVGKKEETIKSDVNKQVEVEHQGQLSEYQAHLQLREKEDKAGQNQREFSEKHRLSNDIQPQGEGSNGSRQRVGSEAPLKEQSTMVPSSLTFNWKRCKDVPEGISLVSQVVILNGKLYVRGVTEKAVMWTEHVLEYIPDQGCWSELPQPTVGRFTIATLRGQLLMLGGHDMSTYSKVNTILIFDECTQKWIQSYSTMPRAVLDPAVVEYQEYLIVAGGAEAMGYIPDVNILNTSNNRWKTAQPLPSAEYYNTVTIQDTVYLVASFSQTVLRAHMPTLISTAKSCVWEILQNVLHCRSSPITFGNTLLTVGGRDKSQGGNSTTSIQMYDPTTNQWTRVGDLPEAMEDSHCTILSGKLFVLGGFINSSVYVATITICSKS